MDTWIELTSWNMVCHRTMATLNSPDFGLLSFAMAYQEYLIAFLYREGE